MYFYLVRMWKFFKKTDYQRVPFMDVDVNDDVGGIKR